MKHHSQKVTVQSTAGIGWETVQRQLESAVEEARLVAMACKRYGILVTRHSQNTFTVAISPEVPYGMTYERDNRPVSSQDDRGIPAT